MNVIEQVRNLADKNFEELVSLRRYLHRHPELSFEEYSTTQYIRNYIEDKGYGKFVALGDTGGYVDLKGKSPDSQSLALRADIDALPIKEENSVEYKSENEGVMHACGHDVHMTSLIGAMGILHELKDQWQGTIRCIFQPGEERLPGGASILIDRGVLKNPDIRNILGQHVMPLVPAGKAGFRPGLYMASADEIYIKVKGKGGHGAHPHMNIDPVIISAQIITQLQTIISRHAKPSIPSVLSIGKVIANGSTNVIPDEVYMEGTFRTYDEEWRIRAHALIVSMCKEIAAVHGAVCEIEVRKGYPFLKNDPEYTERSKAFAIEFLGEENVVDLEIWPAGEDFAYYSQKIPACFYRLGTGFDDPGVNSMLHTPTFNIDEKALKVGAGLMAYLAIREANENNKTETGR